LEDPVEDPMNRGEPPPGAAGEYDPSVTPDPVQVASEESFPASDAPGWQPLHLGRIVGHADEGEADESSDREP
jgi:hypothetical protein